MSKITEVLKIDVQETVLIAYVSTDSGKLISVEDDLMIQSGATKATPFEFKLTSPTFEVISSALKKVYGEGGGIDMASAGKVVFDSCYLGNQGSLDEIQKHNTLYASLCIKCYHEVVDIAHIEYKKK